MMHQEDASSRLLCPPSPATVKRMHAEIPVDPEAVRQMLDHLKEWLAKQPHLPAEDDDLFLERFLYGCKNSLSRCKQVLDMYYTVRAAVPEFYKDRDATRNDLRDMSNVTWIAPLPWLTTEGYRMVLVGLEDTDPDKFDIEVALKRDFMIVDSLMSKEKIHGLVPVVDCKGATWAHITKLTPTLIRKTIVCGQDALPIRIKNIHVLNAPAFVEKFVSFVKPLVKPKLRNRIFVHTGGIEALYELYPAKIFPKECGGQAPSIKEINSSWQKLLESERDWFLKQESKIADESKRPGKMVDSGELFGVEGSFRTLVID